MKFQKTALIYACSHENLQIVQLLLQYKGIDVNAKCIRNFFVFDISMLFLSDKISNKIFQWNLL